MSGFEVVHSGDEGSTSYRMYFKKDGNVISPFHDIPLVVDQEAGVFNMVVEIPRGTNRKMEISTKEAGNPVKQDVKNGKLRVVDNVSPWEGYLWHYGAFPQTWEDNSHVHPETKAKGDNDPLDVCDISSLESFRGEVKAVKVLGTLALIDEGETDWKIIAIDVRDERAADLNDIDDLEKYFPGFSFATHEWLRTYKIPAGKPPNAFGFDGELKNRKYALDVIHENYGFWKTAIGGGEAALKSLGKDGLSSVSNGSSPYHVAKFEPSLTAHVEVEDDVEVPLSAHPVAAAVAVAMRESPHGATFLPDALAAIIDDKIQGDSHQFASAAIKSVNGKANHVDAKGYAQFDVFYCEKSRSAGVYHAKTPNLALKFGDDEVLKKINEKGFDLVAAVVGSSDGRYFYVTTGPGRGALPFSFEDGKVEFDASAPRLQLSNLPNGDELLAHVAVKLLFTAAISS